MDKPDDVRCAWCLGSDLYKQYHDREWGRACRDSRQLFELLCLEGAQAGLSWITILRKRDAYRQLFAGFDPVRIARFTDSHLEKIAANPAIVRHRLKVFSVRSNARAWLELQQAGQDFSDFVWRYVDHQVVHNAWTSQADVPATTAVSLQMSKDLKKAGFSFVGATTCYAFMQASGLVNDHLVSCPSYAQLSSAC